MTTHQIDPDSLIFDMDGTLWDAVDSYCQIWDITFEQCGVKREAVTRDLLMKYMGRHLEDITAALAPEMSDCEDFLERLNTNERTMMPVLSGRFYPAVQETIQTLAKGRKLFMVSNCGSHGLENFIDLAGIRPYITEALSHGGTGLPKDKNIADLIARYKLNTPYYVGDTQGDSDAAHAAGAKMIFCAYGFGKVTNAEHSIDSFAQLAELVKLH